MANTDSFIEEVNEELRRDRLFRLFRKWGWLPILIILIIVGAAAWREYSMAQERAASEAFGNALISALNNDEAAARVSGLQAVDAESQNARMLVALLLAAEQATGEGATDAAADLRALASQDGIPPRYADLALLKAHLIAPQPFDAAMQEMTDLARPGRPYRPLAMEQQALLHAGNGDRDAAIALLRLIEEDSQTTSGLQQRASQLIVALESGAVLEEPAPEQDATAGEDDGSGGAAETEAGAEPATDGTATEANDEEEPEATGAEDN